MTGTIDGGSALTIMFLALVVCLLVLAYVGTWWHNWRGGRFPLPGCPDPAECAKRGPCPFCEVRLVSDGERA